MDYRVLDYNAYADGNTLDTLAIQRAIDECSITGGRVIFDANHTYRSGLIILKDNVELHFEKNAMLKASDNISDFSIDKNVEIKKINGPTWDNCDYSGSPKGYFIYAKDCKNITLSGEGILDGNEEIFYGTISKYHIDGFYYPRVPLIFFENCKNVNIKNINIQRSGFWTVHLVGCDGVLVDGINIKNNLKLACCDGIDPDSCKNVVIKNCYIEAADDCIVFKTTEAGRKYGGCENIEAYNNTLMSTSAAVKIGSESVSDFKNIYVHDCNIIKSNRGIAFQLRDEGNISNIKFENINIETRRFSPVEWWGKAEPIVVTAVKRKLNSKIGSISNIIFDNIICDSENGIFIYGDDMCNISNIKFNKINLKLSSKTKWPKNNHDLRPCEKIGFIEIPMNAVYVKNAKNIDLANINYDVDDSIKNEICDMLLINECAINVIN